MLTLVSFVELPIKTISERESHRDTERDLKFRGRRQKPSASGQFMEHGKPQAPSSSSMQSVIVCLHQVAILGWCRRSRQLNHDHMTSHGAPDGQVQKGVFV